MLTCILQWRAIQFVLIVICKLIALSLCILKTPTQMFLDTTRSTQSQQSIRTYSGYKAQTSVYIGEMCICRINLVQHQIMVL